MTAAGAGRTRVALLIGSLELGGAERQLVALANGLDRDRFGVEVITWFGSDPLAAELAPDVTLTRLRLQRLGAVPAAAWPLLAARVVAGVRGRLAATRPHLLHAYLATAYQLGAVAARLAEVPVVVAGRRGLHAYSQHPLPVRVLGRAANRVIDLHVCNSAAGREFALRHEPDLRPERVVVIPNGVAAAPAGPAPGTPEAGRLAVLMVANLHPVKNHRLALEALARVRAEGAAVTLALAGAGPERAALEERAAGLGLAGSVAFLGARDDVPELLRRHDTALLASTEEGMPNAVLEAMAAGTPVVASRVGGVAELVRDGEDGLLFESGDAAGLARALGRLAADPALRRRLGESARRRAEAEFSVERMVRRTEAAYRELLARRGVPTPL